MAASTIQLSGPFPLYEATACISNSCPLIPV
ncbi:hypothetical protein NITLEN_11060 [Nitrospira lenta]|uniref:Uncharacterized protein n=1 Tax=Nitrospira lenta TaxID=1436998 RepID=A0A330L2V5_9BACT|nr:hypothetical protein NITLEN_11060 [Nitrospira lenta]